MIVYIILKICKIMVYYLLDKLSRERRIIKMSVDDVLSIVREYQEICHNSCCYEHTRELLAKADFYVPEDV